MPRYRLFGNSPLPLLWSLLGCVNYISSRIHILNSTVKILLDLKAGYKVQLRQDRPQGKSHR
ncbi:unnamed protein product [Oncorhynchus mykiss]|uniref:Uncharacterized protein n=1 Tax=Oncorhynchus mykiss TaxID=8022 RepID=A0A061A916_ONCMY|nr:unnamed protein product [Oncorhynchus mykiss]